MKKIYITGTSGTGKTTVAEELTKKGYLAISIDEVEGLCSWIDQETGENHGGKDANMTKEFIDKHDWVCDINYLQKLMAIGNKDVVFVLGMATNQNEYLGIFDKIILLQCKPGVFSKRIEERVGNKFGKDKEVQQQIIERSKTYAQEMASLGAVTIDTERSIGEVVDIVLKIATE